MSILCGGKDNFIVDCYWLLRYLLSRKKETCPRCGYIAFGHGFYPNDREYCTKCHLWESE